MAAPTAPAAATRALLRLTSSPFFSPRATRSFSVSSAALNSSRPPPPIGSSTSALDYKLKHRLKNLPPLPSLEPRPIDAGEAVSNILYNTPPPSTQPFKRHILNVLVQNEPGVLSRVSGTLAARGFNIDSLVVCGTEIKDLSRMCIVLRGQDGVVEQARRQLEDLVPVWAVLDYTKTKAIERELLLVKVSILGPEYFEDSQMSLGGGEPHPSATPPAAGLRGDDAAAQPPHGADGHVPPELAKERGSASSSAQNHTQRQPLTPTDALRVQHDNMRSIANLAAQFRGRIVDVSNTCVTVECSAKTGRIDALLKLLRPFGIMECARSGTMVMPRTPISSSWTGTEDDVVQDEMAAIDASLLPPG